MLDGLSYSADVAFRKLGFAAIELLECLVKCRTDAALANQSGTVFDWKTAAEQLEMLEGGLSLYLVPAEPALEKATTRKPMTICEVDANSAAEALRRLARNTAKAFWFFHAMTPAGAKKLEIPSDQGKVFEEAGLLASLTALTQAEVRELRKHLEREIADAKNEALSDVSCHPGEVARSKYSAELLADFWSDIGHNKPGSDVFLPVSLPTTVALQHAIAASKRERKADSPQQPPNTPRKLVTIKQVADIVHLETRSMTKYLRDWGTPVVTHRGRRPAKYDLAMIQPKLETQFPNTNDDAWMLLETNATQS